MAEEDDMQDEIHNVNVTKLDNGRFKVVFGTKTEIPNLYSAATEVEIDRPLLEQFIENAQKVLEE